MSPSKIGKYKKSNIVIRACLRLREYKYVVSLSEQWIFSPKALKSCSSSQPHRIQSPLVPTREKQDESSVHHLANEQAVEVFLKSSSSPTISPNRRNLQPPVRRVALSPEALQRRLAVVTSMRHCNPEEELALLDQSAGEHSSQSQQQVKPKTVRWVSHKGTLLVLRNISEAKKCNMSAKLFRFNQDATHWCLKISPIGGTYKCRFDN